MYVCRGSESVGFLKTWCAFYGVPALKRACSVFGMNRTSSSGNTRVSVIWFCWV